MNHPQGKPFILAGNWAYSNLGCEAIVRGTTTVLREGIGECYFISHYFTEQKCSDAQRETDPSIIHRPFPFFPRYSLPWIQDQIERRLFHRPPFSRAYSKTLVRSFEGAQAVLMLGGDTFSPYYDDADTYFGLSSVAVSQNLPVAIWGASIGPFSDDRDYESWATEKLRQISLLCVRETETLSYLESIGLKQNVVLSADPAFHLEPSPCKLPSEIVKVLAGGCIGLNLSPLLWRYMSDYEPSHSWQKNLQSWVQLAAEIIRNLLNRFSMPILLIPHVFSEVGDEMRDDYLFLHRVTKMVREPDGVFLLGPGLNAAQTKWVIGQTSVFCGARSHSTLAAISSCVPTICIGYSMKARGISKDVYGHLDWLIKGQDLVDTSILGDRMASLYERESEVRSHLERMNPIFQQRTRDAVKKLIDCGF